MCQNFIQQWFFFRISLCRYLFIHLVKFLHCILSRYIFEMHTQETNCSLLKLITFCCIKILVRKHCLLLLVCSSFWIDISILPRIEFESWYLSSLCIKLYLGKCVYDSMFLIYQLKVLQWQNRIYLLWKRFVCFVSEKCNADILLLNVSFRIWQFYLSCNSTATLIVRIHRKETVCQFSCVIQSYFLVIGRYPKAEGFFV